MSTSGSIIIFNGTVEKQRRKYIKENDAKAIEGNTQICIMLTGYFDV